MQTDSFIIGEIVRYHRKRSGLSQLELAELAGVGKTSVFDVEKGKASVRLNTLLAILSTLNITLNPCSPLMAEFTATKRSKGDRQT